MTSKRLLSLCIFLLLLAGCGGTLGIPGLESRPYDPAGEVSPVTVDPRYSPRELTVDEFPPDAGLALLGIAQMVRGEVPDVEGLKVDRTVGLTEPGGLLEEFDLDRITILERVEQEIVPGKSWETKTTAMLTFSRDLLQALAVAEAQCMVSAEGVLIEDASIRFVSPLQPRVASWFVPREPYLEAIATNDPLPVWEIMALTDAMAVPVGKGLPAYEGRFLAVSIVLDRLEVDDVVKGWMSSGPDPRPGMITVSRTAFDAMGFPVLLVDVKGPLNDISSEQWLHVSWRPADAFRTGGQVMDVPVGRFSTSGTVFGGPAPERTARAAPVSTPRTSPAAPASAAPRAAVSPGDIESGRVALDPRDTEHAKTIQARLAELGFYTMAVDGKFGKGSYAALQACKKALGLNEDLIWDMATQKALFAGSGR